MGGAGPGQARQAVAVLADDADPDAAWGVLQCVGRDGPQLVPKPRARPLQAVGAGRSLGGGHPRRGPGTIHVGAID